MGEAAAGLRRDRAGAGGSAAGTERLRAAGGADSADGPPGAALPRARPLAGWAAPGGNSGPGSCPRFLPPAARPGRLPRGRGRGRRTPLGALPRPRSLPAGAAPPRAGDDMSLALGVAAEEIPRGTRALPWGPTRFPRKPGCGTREPRNPRAASRCVPEPEGNRGRETVGSGASIAGLQGAQEARRGGSPGGSGKFIPLHDSLFKRRPCPTCVTSGETEAHAAAGFACCQQTPGFVAER